jgi:hypothetical protein
VLFLLWVFVNSENLLLTSHAATDIQKLSQTISIEIDGKAQFRRVSLPSAQTIVWEGKKADQGQVSGMSDDPTPLPKCEKEDECSWQCDVPKAPGSKETEPKELKTVGEFVKFCLLPTMEH